MENKHWVIYPSLNHNNKCNVCSTNVVHNYFYGELATVTDKTVTVLVPPELQYYRKNNKCNVCSTHVVHNCKEATIPKYKCLLLKDEFTYNDVVSWYKPYLKEYIKIYGGTEMYFFTADGIPMIGRVTNQTTYGVTLQVQFEQFGISRTFKVRMEYNQIIPAVMISSYF